MPHRRDVKLGVMIEVPAAAMIADLLAREVDFFSIGTNDLIQYSLAVDRNNEHVADLYQPLHPAILRMLRFVVDSAARPGSRSASAARWAATRGTLPLLVGLGLRRLSMSPRAVPEIKSGSAELDAGELARAGGGAAATLATAAEVESFLETRARSRPTASACEEGERSMRYRSAASRSPGDTS